MTNITELLDTYMTNITDLLGWTYIQTYMHTYRAKITSVVVYKVGVTWEVIVLERALVGELSTIGGALGGRWWHSSLGHNPMAWRKV